MTPDTQHEKLVLRTVLDSLKETSECIRRVEYATRHWLSIDGPLLPEEWKNRAPHTYALWERAVDAIDLAEPEKACAK